MNKTVSKTPEQTVNSPQLASGILQRSCACGQRTIGGSECTECSKNGLSLQRAPRNSKLETRSSGGVPPVVHEVLRSPGQPLDAATRAFFEPRFGHDFSRVRVHTDARAAESARAVNAIAYTVGREVVFGEGQYAAETSAGQRLLAHELTHTIQQERTTTLMTSALRVGKSDDIHEQEADRAADQLFAAPARPAVSEAPQGSAGSVGLTPVSNIAMQRAPTPTTTQSPVSKDPAQSALLDWKERADAFLEGTRGWMAANWTAYFGLTSSNPSLGWQETFVYNVASNAFGNAISDAAKAAFSRILKKGAVKLGAAAVGAGVGAAIGSVPGAIIGFVVGVLIESIASLIFDAIFGKKELDEVAAKASRATALLIESKTAGFEKEGQRAKRDLDLDFRIKQSALTSTSSQAEVDGVQKWASEEAVLIKDPPNLDDRSLYAQMIREWILEHAGDEEDENKTTSAAQWQYALKVSKDPTEVNEERREMKLPPLPKALKAGADLDRHPEIFAYQTRGHWNDAGLPLLDEAQKMIQKVPDILAQGPQNPADTVKAFFDGMEFFVYETKQPQLLIRLINTEDTDFVLVEEQKQHIEKGQFMLVCRLDLDEADGSVYVNKWKYEVFFDGPLPDQTCAVNVRNGQKVCGHPVRETSFGVSPD